MREYESMSIYNTLNDS